MQTVSVRLDKTQKKKIQSKHAKAANSQTGGHVSTKRSICKYKLIPSGLLYSMLVVTDSWKQLSLNSKINFGGNKMVKYHPREQQERYYIKELKFSLAW